MTSEALWGIDLGGTKIEGVVAYRAGKILEPIVRPRIATEAERGYEWIVKQLARLVADMESQSGLVRPGVIGIGTPGSVRPDGTMKNCNTTCLNGRRLSSDLESALGVRVAVRNDADCFALAEAVLGAGRGFRTVFGVIMGTGVGGGIVVDGRLVTGANGLAGEWGHTILEPGGRPCYCGRHGCVEQYISGPAVERDYMERTGRDLSLRNIVELAGEDAECADAIERMCVCFGRALSTVVNILDPDVVVLGGGAGQVPALRTSGLAILNRNVFGPDFITPLASPALGDSAGVFGAALLAEQSS